MGVDKLPDYIDPKRTFGCERMPVEREKKEYPDMPLTIEARVKFKEKFEARKAAYGKLPELPKTKNFRQLRGK